MTGLLFNFKDVAVLMPAFLGTLIGLFFLGSKSGNPSANKVLGHLAADLKLDDLAQKVSLPPKTLSILLNVHYKMNFCEFINHHRIQEATSILSDPRSKDKAVLDIAMQAGFHSKSAFNRAFKKETGVTPLNYRQRVIGAEPIHDS